MINEHYNPDNLNPELIAKRLKKACINSIVIKKANEVEITKVENTDLERFLEAYKELDPKARFIIYEIVGKGIPKSILADLYSLPINTVKKLYYQILFAVKIYAVENSRKTIDQLNFKIKTRKIDFFPVM